MSFGNSSYRGFRQDLESITEFRQLNDALRPDHVAIHASIREHVGHFVATCTVAVQETLDEWRLTRAEAAANTGQCTIRQVQELTRDGQAVVVYPFKR